MSWPSPSAPRRPSSPFAAVIKGLGRGVQGSGFRVSAFRKMYGVLRGVAIRSDATMILHSDTPGMFFETFQIRFPELVMAHKLRAWVCRAQWVWAWEFML